LYRNVCEVLSMHDVPTARPHGTTCLQEVYQRWLTGGLAAAGNHAPTSADRLAQALPSHVTAKTRITVVSPFGDGLTEIERSEMFRLAQTTAEDMRGTGYQQRFGSASVSKAPPPVIAGAVTVAEVAAGVMAKMPPTPRRYRLPPLRPGFLSVTAQPPPRWPGLHRHRLTTRHSSHRHRHLASTSTGSTSMAMTGLPMLSTAQRSTA